MIAGRARFIFTTTVYESGVSTASTWVYQALRALGTPFGGKMILSSVALMSAEVSGVPSWNFAFLRRLNT